MNPKIPTYQETPKEFKLLAMEVRNNHRLTGHTPMTVYVLDGDQVSSKQVPVEMTHPDCKWMVEEQMLELARAGAKAVVLVSEAWFVKPESSEEAAEAIKSAESQRLHTHKDKIECLMLSYNSPDHGCTAIAKIDGCKVQDWEIMPHGDSTGVQASGRFVNILRSNMNCTGYESILPR